MPNVSQDFLTWLVNQGVAVAVLVFLLVRLESRMAKLETLLQQLADRAYGQAAQQYQNPTGTGHSPS
jgi:hypothetical protein